MNEAKDFEGEFRAKSLARAQIVIAKPLNRYHFQTIDLRPPFRINPRVIFYWRMGAAKPTNNDERAFSGVSFRTDSALETRLDAVASTAQLSRARVAKLCVIRGLERLEEELALMVKVTAT